MCACSGMETNNAVCVCACVCVFVRVQSSNISHVHARVHYLDEDFAEQILSVSGSYGISLLFSIRSFLFKYTSQRVKEQDDRFTLYFPQAQSKKATVEKGH